MIKEAPSEICSATSARVPDSSYYCQKKDDKAVTWNGSNLERFYLHRIQYYKRKPEVVATLQLLNACRLRRGSSTPTFSISTSSLVSALHRQHARQ
jgi:hypothetical protein